MIKLNRRIISNVMVITGCGIILFTLFYPIEDITNESNLIVNVSIWIILLGNLLKFTYKN